MKQKYLRVTMPDGSKWDVPGPEYSPGYEVFECVRCGIACREKEDTGEREMWY